jgi:transcriptional regulator with XRE-family HTH domain
MRMSKTNPPYISLGSHLKYVREQSSQTIAEVSGAVEIDEQHLEKIEAGLVRPEEDILLLLISYFGVKDREAVQLWELADYDSDMPEEIRPADDPLQLTGGKPTIMLLAMDLRTIYSDGMEINVNPAGVTLNFTQSQSPTQSNSVGRIGMSHAQAEAVIQTMQRALLHSKYNGGKKLLPPPQKTD